MAWIVARLWTVFDVPSVSRMWSALPAVHQTPGMEPFHSTITPVLTVRNAVQAVEFYQRAFGAEEIYRNTYPDGRIVAEMAVGHARFRVADEAPESNNLSPEALSGTSVRLNLLVPDPDGLAERAIANGAKEISPIADQTYGLRQGRLVDPYGHHWLVGRPLAGPAGDWAQQSYR
jgi:PhnB protein